jgi:hypothetical protein
MINGIKLKHVFTRFPLSNIYFKRKRCIPTLWSEECVAYNRNTIVSYVIKCTPIFPAIIAHSWTDQIQIKGHMSATTGTDLLT